MTLADRLRRAVVDANSLPLAEDESHLVEDRHSLRAAAVLIAVTDRPQPGLLFVERPHYMRSHPGQIAFPGGKVEPDDDDAIAAALREAQEELALPADAAEIIGLTDRFHTGSGFDIQPVIAVVAPDLPLKPCPEEVADWFEAPLDFVLDPANATRHSRQWRGKERHYHEIMWQERRIWGITAGILQNLRRRLELPL